MTPLRNALADYLYRHPEPFRDPDFESVMRAFWEEGPKTMPYEEWRDSVRGSAPTVEETV